MNNCQQMNQKQLLQWIDQISFVLTDLLLYLDTHPTDKEAIALFSKYNEERQQALHIYETQFDPLVLDYMPSRQDYWTWVTAPWPWEGGCH